MAMFKRTKAKDTTAPRAGGVRFTDAEEDAVTALWRLTALPRAEFDATYGELLRRCWRAVAAPRGAHWTALRERALSCAVAALKVRQAHMLPRFAAAEDAARLTEAMSFALAACVLAERFGQVLGRAAGPDWSPLDADAPADAVAVDVVVPRSFGAFLLPRLVGKAGREWLGEQPEALREAAAYFGAGPSELRAIADDAAARIGMPVVPAPAEREAAEENAGPPEGRAAVAPGAPSTAGATAAPVGPAAEAERAPSDIGDGRVGWRWVNWVRACLRDGSVRANAEGGWLHNIDGAAYVVVPDGFEALAAAESTTPKSIRNRVLRLGRHRSRRSAGGRADAFAAELTGGRRVSGMVFPGKLFWDEDAPPASTSVLL